MSAKSITVTPVLNGFIVEVGCQKAIIGSIPILMHEIGRYYTMPKEVEEEYLKHAINKPDSMPPSPERYPVIQREEVPKRVR